MFAPVFKEKIWGGDKIRTVLGKEYPGLANCGETWEVSAIESGESVVASGPLAGLGLRELVARYGPRLLGEGIYSKYGKEFSLLVKFISADDDLSIQVHPGDAMARRYHAGRGKAEMWYVLDADPGAGLISGFIRPVTREEYLGYFHSGHLEDILQRVPVKKGDCFFLPPGRVHSIGRGILLAEIQQSSDITYRIYDFNRRDTSGHPRELHVEKALEAMDFSASGDPKVHYRPQDGEWTPLVDCPYFSTGLLRCTKPLHRDIASGDSFIIYTCVAGTATIRASNGALNIRMGECVLIPASLPSAEIVPGIAGVDLLETRPK